jgi:Rrf2 family cysteine metabolism transcriptional repressor
VKLLTKQTDYAVRAVMKLARYDEGFVSSRHIAREEGIPLQFLRSILQKLKQNRLVESREGVGGGVRLKTDPSDIRIADLMRLFQGDIQLTECMFRRKICSNRKTCVLRKRIKRIEDMVTREFEDMTIEDLLRDLEEQNEA